MTPFRIIFQTIIVVAVFALAWWLRGCREPDVIERTETVYVDRELVRTDTVTKDRPVTRYIYQRTTDTVIVRIPVPIGFHPHGVISPTPVRIEGRDITLSYWSPDSLRWIQDVYAVKPPRFAATLSIEAGHDLLPSASSVGLRASVRYRRLFVYAEPSVSVGGLRGAGAGVTVGVGVDLLRLDR